MSEEKPYSYLDTPDGQDVFKKLYCVMVPTSKIAIAVAATDVILHSKPKGYLPTLGRMAYIAFPIVSAGAAFVLATNSLAAIRKKDDTLNWILGGFASGSIFGAYTRRGMLGFNLGLFFGICGLISKIGIQNNYEFVPDIKKRHHNIGLHDWSLTKERPKNWTTGQ